MSYNRTNWQTGDIVTAEKLNNMEGRITTAEPFRVTFTTDGIGSDDTDAEITCDKRVEEIIEAFNAGKYVYGIFTVDVPDIGVLQKQIMQLNSILYTGGEPAGVVFSLTLAMSPGIMMCYAIQAVAMPGSMPDRIILDRGTYGLTPVSES